MKRILAAGGALATCCALLVVATAPTATASTPGSLGACARYQSGNHKLRVFTKHFVWVVKQQDQEENFSGHEEQLKFTDSDGGKLTNSVTSHVSVSASVSGSVWKVFKAQVNARTGLDVGYRGETWYFHSVTRKFTLGTGHVYEWGRGRGRWYAHWARYRCQRMSLDGRYEWVRQVQGVVNGYPLQAHALVRCNANPPSGSFSATLKRRYCP